MGKTSNWSRTSASDEDFTRAAWDAARDAELTTNSIVTVKLRLSQQRGVWIFASTLETAPTAAYGPLLARCEASYPNARAASLAAFLFAHMNSLSQMGESAHADRMRAALSRGR